MQDMHVTWILQVLQLSPARSPKSRPAVQACAVCTAEFQVIHDCLQDLQATWILFVNGNQPSTGLVEWRPGGEHTSCSGRGCDVISLLQC